MTHIGIDNVTLKTIISLYGSMQSCVRYRGLVSDWFRVTQGTRQGGKSSPILYLLYINDLIRLLETSKVGCKIYERPVCSPTVADDMVLYSLSKDGLNTMLDICFNYSMKWRYEYNPQKCAVVVYNEPKGNLKSSNRLWKL